LLSCLIVEYLAYLIIMSIVSAAIFKRVRFFDPILLLMLIFLTIHPFFKIIYCVVKIYVIKYLINHTNAVKAPTLSDFIYAIVGFMPDFCFVISTILSCALEVKYYI